MSNNRTKVIIVSFLLSAVIGSVGGHSQELKGGWSPAIHKTWDEQAMQSLELPLADAAASPKHISADYYYRIPVRPIYKSYTIYHPDKEPAGYLDSLRKQEPEIVFDASKLNTEEDWIKAGEIVFDSPIEFVSSGILFSEIRGRAWFSKNRVPVTKDGIFPFMRYVVREKGKVELGILSCAMCHSRVMPDKSVIKGAQGNFPDDRAFGYETRVEAAQAKDKNEVLKELRRFMRRSYAAPWLRDDPNAKPDQMSLEEIIAVLDAIPPGVCARQGASAFYPPRIPDLIGVRERRFLDATGLFRHRTIGDLMRYAALNQGIDFLSVYGGFRPEGELPDPSTRSRYSDEQLYALALFVYSLKPPANPNKFDALAARGQRVFERENCAECHTPPTYTNDKLAPADGFNVPDEHRKQYDIMPMSVGTDPRLALMARRGTGYYKTPSLRGVWYRGPFEHNGSVATLEDWFDPRRLRDDYAPTGFRGYGVKSRAVKGHQFGLDLSTADRKALIAFLKTL
ncbi:MAG TPA: hypothetical protein VJ810_13040 [Blastocatellia bacterium]|nr:hypothetical protein [Blastocatellia bacterium]